MKWFRFYSEALHDPKVRRLPSGLFKDWVLVLCLANEGKPRGVLPPVKDIAYHFNRTPAKVEALLSDLQGRGLLDEKGGGLMPHNWRERQPGWDDSAERQRRHRGRDNNATVTVSSRDRHRLEEEAETEQNRTDSETEEEAEETLLPLLTKHYENEIGSLTAIVEDELRDWARKIPDERFVEYAFNEASANGARNWKYVATIFSRLEAEGWPADPGAIEGERDYGDGNWYRDRYARGQAGVAEEERGSQGERAH